MINQKRLVAPSILAANFANLEKDIALINESEADWIHCDIMDGVFVPNISFGLPVVYSLKKIAKKPLDVHLMIVNPERYIKDFFDAGANILTVHYEASIHLHRTIEEIKKYGMLAGVSINPHTPVNLLELVIPMVDMVLIMSVNPGFGGQKFIDFSYEKIKQLRRLSDKLNPELLIEVDGGVDLNNAKKLYESGVNILVAGTTIFESDDIITTIKSLKNA